MQKSAVIITAAAIVASLAGGAAAYAGTQGAAPAGPAPAAQTTPAGAADAELDAAIDAALAEVGSGTVVDADRDDAASHAYEIDVRLDSGGDVEVKLDADLAIVSVHEETADDDGSTDDDASADGSSEDEVTEPATRDKAADAALAEVGGGTVVSIELSDDADHVYEVEIDLGDGKDADVELDADFAVVKVD